MVTEYDSLDIRPYQLMCIVCRLGSDGSEEYDFAERLDEILSAVRKDANRPLTLRCNVESPFAYQNPGRAWDTPEGGQFNAKRDLDILHRLGMTPGATRPAHEMFIRLFQFVPTCAEICGYAQETSEAWRGCRLAHSGNYERGWSRGVSAVVPARDEADKAAAKKASCAEMYAADILRIRPHHLMCLTCFFGGKTPPAPIQEDNLFEVIDIVQKNPEIPIELIAGPCIICPPCKHYDKRGNLCVGKIGGGMRDEKKDLDVLRILGLSYGDRIPARELFQRVLQAIRSTREICGYGDGVERAPEWRICGGAKGSPNYTRGRAAGLDIPGVEIDDDDNTEQDSEERTAS